MADWNERLSSTANIMEEAGGNMIRFHQSISAEKRRVTSEATT